MPDNSQNRTRLPNLGDNSIPLAPHACQVEQTISCGTIEESQDLGFKTESLGVEFRAEEECLWPDLELFKSTREF